MTAIRIDRDPSRRQLTVFGIIWLVFFSFGALIVWQRTGWRNVALLLLGAAWAIPLIGWVVPAFLRLVYVAMAYLTFPVGLVLSFLILATAYYLVLTPIGLAMRLFGYDPMRSRFDAGAKTYWSRRAPPEHVDRYFRQF